MSVDEDKRTNPFADPVEEPAKGDGAKRRGPLNHLPGLKRFKLWKWMEENKVMLGEVTSTKAAEEATKAMGFTVTAANIQHGSEATGVHTARMHATCPGEMEARVAALEAEVKSLRAMIMQIPRPLFS